MTTEETVDIQVGKEAPISEAPTTVGQTSEAQTSEAPVKEDKPKSKRKAKIRKVIREKPEISDNKRNVKSKDIVPKKSGVFKYLILIVGSGLAIMMSLIIAKRFKLNNQNKGQIVKHEADNRRADKRSADNLRADNRRADNCPPSPTTSIRNYFR